MTKQISVYGATGFVGSRFCELYESEICKIDRNHYDHKSNDILYFISTIDNYNVYNDLHISDNYIVSNSVIHPRNMVFDFWSIGSLDHMETKSKYLDEIDRYWFTTDMYHYCYEHALHAYLCDNNFKRYRSNMQYNVPRINNMITAYN